MDKIVIIKLGADGDVLRTIPLVEGIKHAFPHSEITWITKKSVSEMLEGLSFVNRVEVLPFSTSEKFDRLYNFDMDDEAAHLASTIEAKKKYGFYKEGGYAAAFNAGAEYYLNTVFDDSLKKSNKRTYQDMMSELAEISVPNKPYHLVLNAQDKEYAREFFSKEQLQDKKVVGIHMGASSRWPSKIWHHLRLKEFIVLAHKKGYEVLLFGGPNEVESQKKFLAELQKENVTVRHNDPHNTKRQFAALVERCESIVCSDSFALHVALGLGKKTVCLFFCTSPDEVEGYNLLHKIVSPMLLDYFPERSNEYSEELVKSISSEQVLKAII